MVNHMFQRQKFTLLFSPQDYGTAQKKEQSSKVMYCKLWYGMVIYGSELFTLFS